MRRALLLAPLLLRACTLFILRQLDDVSPESLCGNGIAQLNVGEECDGQDLNEQSCVTFDPSFISGQLSCTERCSFDTSNCLVTPPCGDGLIELGEACDDENFAGGDGCDELCQLETGFVCNGEPSICQNICGDGLTVGLEGCDDGNTDEEDGCLTSCLVSDGFVCEGDPIVCLLPQCGDDALNPGEGCDDGNKLSGDGCDQGCRIEPGFVCSGTPSGCVLPNCGDGLLDLGEQCDDGCGGDGACDALDDNDGCESSCRFLCGGDSGADLAARFQDRCYLAFDVGLNHNAAQAQCQARGAHLATISESLEDVFLATLLAKLPSQASLAWLGMIEGTGPGSVSGFVWLTGEPLSSFQNFNVNQPTNSVDPDCGALVLSLGWKTLPCSTGNRFLCESEARCGDGVVGNSADEVCDDGNNQAGDSCRPDCTGVERCGDGLVDDAFSLAHPEECDDGNDVNDDGCSRVCQLE